MDEEQDLNEIKQERAAKIIYITLAVIITVTMVISVVSAVNRRGRKSKLPLPDEVSGAVTTDAAEKNGTASVPHIITPPKDQKPETEPRQTEAPVTEPEATDAAKEGPADEPGEDNAPAATERVYTVPVNGSVIKDFTMDLPVYSVTMNDYRVHNGMDLHASVGDPVCAFTDGVISRVYGDPMMGQTVVIDHGDGLCSVYQNLQTVLPDGIDAGVSVKSGDVIGAVGETSLTECAEVPHLHFSLVKDGQYAAPSDYLGPIYAEE